MAESSLNLSDFKVGDRVTHRERNIGKITKIEEDIIHIDTPSTSYGEIYGYINDHFQWFRKLD